jgi:pimeloyl-[acyl-carrier protein] synthase
LSQQLRNWNVEEFDPTWPDYIQNPYPFYRRLREEDPVHYYPPFDSFWLTRYADVNAVLSDHAKFRKQLPVDEVTAQQRIPLPPELEDLNQLPESMLFVDPPDHTRLRSLVTKAFTPRVVESLRPRITEIVRQSSERIRQSGSKKMDLVRDYAFPIPAIVIAEMLGVPVEDREKFKDWSGKIIRGLDGTQPPGVLMEAGRANLELVRYFEKLIEERKKSRGARGDDLLSALIAAEEQGDKLSMGELLSTCVLLLVAGHETTTNLIASGTYALLRHPDQLKLLREHPELMPTAVEELLRFESPVQRTVRFAATDIKIGETRVSKGQAVVALLAAANRDPSVFNRPEELDIARKENPHLAFGKGIHFCLGAPLARIEGPVALRVLLQEFPNLRLEEGFSPEWNSNTVIRGMRSLSLEF